MSTKNPKGTAKPFGSVILGTLQLCAVIGVVGGTVLLATYLRNNQPERVQVETQTFTPSVQTTTIEAHSRRIPLQKTGSVEPTVYVDISPEVSGVVESVADGLAGGATFEADEILFSIFRGDLAIELRRRKADLAAALASLDIERAQAENARREWESFGRGEITDLAARGPQVRSAEAQVLIAEAQVETAALDLKRAGYSLPFAGRIVETSLAPGQRVSAGQSYGRVYSFKSIEVAVSLSPDELALLDTVIGTQATVTARVLGKPVTLQGGISRIDGEVDRTTRLTTVIVGLDVDKVREVSLQPGTFVTVAFDGPEIENIAEVPNAALQENDQVWLVEDDTLRLSAGLQVVLRDRDTTLVTGLKDGARVALGTIADAANGMKIRAETSVSTTTGPTSFIEVVAE
ncbi:MAG: efflux RND transporter periplasmic adaptor subunit [Pseudomonadota bacterium]